jgi:hypothetical protein
MVFFKGKIFAVAVINIMYNMLLKPGADMVFVEAV